MSLISSKRINRAKFELRYLGTAGCLKQLFKKTKAEDLLSAVRCAFDRECSSKPLSQEQQQQMSPLRYEFQSK